MYACIIFKKIIRYLCSIENEFFVLRKSLGGKYLHFRNNPFKKISRQDRIFVPSLNTKGNGKHEKHCRRNKIL